MAWAPTTRFAAVEGGKLAFDQEGKGTTLVFLHGIPTNRALWRAVCPRLRDHGCCTVAVDLLGYGESDKPTDVDLGITAQARRFIELFQSLRLQHVVLIGHDIGAGVAQCVALARPDLVATLVIVDGIAYDSFPEPSIARLKEPVWDRILGAPDFDLAKGFAKALRRGMFHSDRVTDELVKLYARPFDGVEGRLAYLRAARALRTEELSEKMDEIERLDLPMLAIWGEHDIFQPAGNGRRLAASMRRGSFVSVGDAGHFSPEDAPDSIATLIADFVSDNAMA
jgi:pimeloyl-ACP methyl ester carboxylesterase